MSQEGTGQDEVLDDGQLEDKQNALSELTPSSQDLLSHSALLNVNNDLSTPKKVIIVTSILFYPLNDLPMFYVGNCAQDMNFVEWGKEDQKHWPESSQETRIKILLLNKGSPLRIEQPMEN